MLFLKVPGIVCTNPQVQAPCIAIAAAAAACKRNTCTIKEPASGLLLHTTAMGEDGCKTSNHGGCAFCSTTAHVVTVMTTANMPISLPPLGLRPLTPPDKTLAEHCLPLVP